MLRWGFLWRALAISISIGILVKTSAEQFRDSYTWSNVTNAFVPVPHKISDKAPCLNKDFFNPSRAAGGTFYINSQCAQDISAYKISGEKKNGFFVDLAAHEWSFISNTLSLEEVANWDGLCIEPIPDYAQGILENRRCKLIQNPVFSASNYHVTFKYNSYFSGIVGAHMDNKEAKKDDRQYSFLTVTLMSILQQFKAPFVIDYLSLDIEGAELHALKHFDFGIYTFLCITIERPQKDLHLLLIKHKYWFATILRTNTKARQSFGEALYIHESALNFKQHMEKYRIAEAKDVSL